jgi:putative ABC transport system permease protein
MTALVVKNLIRHPIRTILVVLGLAVSSALLLDMTMLSSGMERSFRDMLLARGFQIRLSPKGTLPFDTEATIARVSPIVAALRRDPAIELAGPVVAAPVRARALDSVHTMVGYGIDPAGQGLYQVEAGRDLVALDTTGLLISQAVAGEMGWAIGDTVILEGQPDPQAGAVGSEERLVVRAVVDWLYDARNQLSIGAHYRVMQRLAAHRDEDAASLIMVKVRRDADVGRVAERIAATFPAVEVNSVAELVSHFRSRMTYFEQLSLILATISLVVTALLVGTILTITVNERLGEFAILRAIGVRRARVVRMVLLEGALLAVAGAGFGTLLGLLTARELDAILTSFPGLPAMISFFVAEPASLARAALLAIGGGVIATGYPAWLAGRGPIAATLRADAE